MWATFQGTLSGDGIGLLAATLEDLSCKDALSPKCFVSTHYRCVETPSHVIDSIPYMLIPLPLLML